MVIGILIAVVLFSIFFLIVRRSRFQPAPKTDYEPIEAVGLTSDEKEFINLINKYRVNNNAPALKSDALASAICLEHCRYMIVEREASHDGFSNRAFELSKNNAKHTGEVVAFGYSNPFNFLYGFKNSERHDAILKRDNYTHIGISIIDRYLTAILIEYDK